MPVSEQAAADDYHVVSIRRSLVACLAFPGWLTEQVLEGRVICSPNRAAPFRFRPTTTEGFRQVEKLTCPNHGRKLVSIENALAKCAGQQSQS